MRNDEDDSLQRELAESSWLLDLARTLVGAGRAEDLVQDAWLERLRRPEEARQPRALMATILRRLAGRSFREEARRRAREDEARLRRERVVDEAAERGKRLAVLWREVEELDDDDRSIVVLRYLDGLEPQHIARKLEISPNAARVRLHRALDRLRHNLDRRHGGRREDWLRALAPLVLVVSPAPMAGASAAPSLTKVTLLMTAQKKLILAATLILMVGGAVYFLRDFGATERGALVEDAGNGAAATETAERADLPRRSAPTETAAAAKTPPAFDQDRLVAGVLEAAIGSTLRDLVAGPRLVSGRVVDARRRPVAGAEILWRPTNGGRITTSSDAQGRFQVLKGGPPVPGTVREGMLSASDDEGRMAVRRIVLDEHVRADRIEVLLVLEAATPFRLSCRDDAGRPVAAARIELQRPDGGRALVGESDQRGLFAGRLPPGTYRLTAAGAGLAAATSLRLRGETEVAIDLCLAPSPALEVLVVDDDDRPIEGAAILLLLDGGEHGGGRLLRSELPETDEAGRCRIEDLGPRAGLEIAARAKGHRASTPLDLAHVASPIEIRLEKRTAISWELRDGEVARPPDGETIRLEPEAPGLEEAGVEDIPLPAGAFGAVPGLLASSGSAAEVIEGRLVVGAKVEDGGWLAVTDRGEVARIWTGEGPEDRGALSFRRPREVGITLTESGVLVAGIGVQVRDLGGDPVRPTATTTAQGRVRFEGFAGGVYDVFVGPPGRMREGAHRVATIDLDEGSREIEVDLLPTLECRIEVRLEGRPGLPARFDLDLQDARIVAMDEDAAAGILRLRYRPLRGRWERPLSLRAEGWLPGETTVPIMPDARVRLDLRPAAQLEASVVLPKDERVHIELLRFDERRRDWVAVDDEPNDEIRDEELIFLYADLGPGRYRLVDRLSRLWSEEVELEEGGRGARLDLDLARVQTTPGRVIGPAGIDLEQVRVGTTGDSIDGRDGWRLFGLPCDGEGRFELRLDRDRHFDIEARHPLALPTSLPSSALPAAGAEILLRLDTGPRIVAALPDDIMPSSRLRVFTADRRDRALAFVSLHRANGRLEFASLRPGRYDLVFDCPPYAPLVVEGVEVGARDVDLGTLAFDLGQEIVIEIKLPEGAEIPDLYVSAQRLDATGAVRFKNAFNENPVRLAGLAPGRYRIEIGAAPFLGDERSFEIVIERGKTPVLSYP